MAPEIELGYVLGIDLGTSYSAAAVGQADGRVEMFQLGMRAAAIPSLVVVRETGDLLVGEAAERRALTEPARTAREFKRRLGDPVPMILGGTPFGSEALLAILFRSIVDQVTQGLGEAPAHVVITHPASYGPYKLDLLRQAARQADLPATSFVSEPVAAAFHYASLEQVPRGATIAVYDFGGGTFDATILRTTDAGFDVAGVPEGLERLGGIDFDEAIFRHALGAIGDQVQALDGAAPTVQAGFARLREESRRAKEALSADSDATIPVSLPGIQTEVRITRGEFEAMIEPRIAETIAALERAARSAGLRIADVDRILLVGGTSRIPRIAERVRAATGRRIAVDAHPKHAVALGAARLGLAARAAATAGPLPGPDSNAEKPSVRVAAAGPGVRAETAAPSAGASRPDPFPRQGRRAPTSAGIVLGVAVLAIAGSALVAAGVIAPAATPTPGPTAAAGAPTLPPAPTPLPTLPSLPRASITGITLADGRYRAAFSTVGFTPSSGGTHVHFFWDTVPPDQAGSPASGPYVVYAGSSPFAELGPGTQPADATGICVIVANPDHTVVPGSGGCAALP